MSSEHTSTDTSSPKTLNPIRSSYVTALLALLTAIGPLSTDMYLPAFPAMKLDLGAAPGQAQLTLAAWFLGLSIGQVTHGPLSDHFGRRWPLLLGTALYTVASIGCAVAFSMTALSFWRVLAAFGGAASLTVPRAVIRDIVVDGIEGARIVGKIVLVMGVVPILAPTAGALVSQHFGWRAIFWIAASYGVICMLLIWRLLPETLSPDQHVTLRLIPILLRYRRVWRDRIFRTHSLEGGCGTFTLFAFLGGAPTVFLGGLHLPPTWFGAVFILNSVGYITGTQINARLMPRFGLNRTLSFSAVLLVAGTLAMLAVSLMPHPSALGLALCMTVCMLALGFMLPGAAIGSLLPHARQAGSASALYGTVVFAIGAVSTILVGLFGSDRPLPMAALMLAGALAAACCDRLRPAAPSLGGSTRPAMVAARPSPARGR